MKPFQSLFDSLPTSALLATRASPLVARTPTCFAFFPTVLEEKRDCSQSMEIHEKDKRIDPNEDQDFVSEVALKRAVLLGAQRAVLIFS